MEKADGYIPLMQNYDQLVGEAWRLEGSDGATAANQYRELRGLPLIELGDGK